MSIETQLSAITGLLEEVLRIMKQGQPAPTIPQSQDTAPPPPGQASHPPAQGIVSPPPAPVPPGPPAMAAPPAPGAPPAPVASPPTAPGALPQAPAPAAPSAPAAPGITLDQIRDKLTQWWRAHPDQSSEIMVILGECNVTKVDDLRPEHYGFVWQKLEALGG